MSTFANVIRTYKFNNLNTQNYDNNEIRPNGNKKVTEVS